MPLVAHLGYLLSSVAVDYRPAPPTGLEPVPVPTRSPGRSAAELKGIQAVLQAHAQEVTANREGWRGSFARRPTAKLSMHQQDSPPRIGLGSVSALAEVSIW